MKYLIVLDERQKEILKEHIMSLEGMPMIRPILKPMYVDTDGYYVYLTQVYVDTLTKTAEKIVIEDAVKKSVDNLLTFPEFEYTESQVGEKILRNFNYIDRGTGMVTGATPEK